MFCSNCGSEIEEGVKFCPSCGAAVEVSSEDTVQEETGYAYPAAVAEEGQTDGAYEQESESQESGGQTYGNQDYGNQAYGTGTFNMHGGTNRNIALCIIFSIISCGIYALYWMYMLNEELNSITGETNGTSGGLVILFSILTCGIYTWYWYYKMGEKVDYIREKQGLNPGSSQILFLILGIFGLGIVNYALMQDAINKTAA